MDEINRRMDTETAAYGRVTQVVEETPTQRIIREHKASAQWERHRIDLRQRYQEKKAITDDAMKAIAIVYAIC